ncbi:MAG: hypothetical protein JWM41_1428 [Gemmatimonadetes bacterium]|nr:hypothetical protein [Gemmatimonadota bacterium]
MGKRRRRTEGHAEGQHGPKTEAAIVEQLQSSTPELPTEARLELDRAEAAYDGKRRLVEDREQHDEAEKNSEHERLFVEHARGRDAGPSDNKGNLHGVLGNREHRADYKVRGPDGLPERGQP